MDFILSNFSFSRAKEHGEIYYEGTCVKIIGEALYVCESADWRRFHSFDENLLKYDFSTPIEYPDFYFVAKYDLQQNYLVMQTDIISYHSVYVYNKNGLFCFSDDVLELIRVLKENNIEIRIHESLARQYIAYNNILLQETIFTDIKRSSAASIIQFDINKCIWSEKIYNEFHMTGEYDDAPKCADAIYKAIVSHFEMHMGKEKFYIGLSGGLDSRVGAFVAKKLGYNIHPYFIGVKNNSLGIRTYDSKRSEEIAKYLQLGEIKYFDPRGYHFRDKVSFDALHAPTMVDNVAQNIGTVSRDFIIINGIIGGEIFGYFVEDYIAKCTPEDLTCYIINNQKNIPIYKSGFLRRLVKAVPRLKFINKYNLCDPGIENELLREVDKKDAYDRIYNWVIRQKNLGLSNLNIFQKFYYINFGSISKTSYYASFSNTVPSLATFLNPSVIKEILKFDPSLIKHSMPIQSALFEHLDGLGNIRSQKPEASINSKKNGRKPKQIGYIVERFLRGSGMNYPSWINRLDIEKYYKELQNKSLFSKAINLKNRAWLDDNRHCYLCLIKVVYLETQIIND